ncbi:PAS domain S-box-containing protein [Altererythrobacter xiamenensis]|uniref:PAS domain S-box-containing protein n=1 Tax=Altererythrobacter xiamenensis TaxID=1316679 RepID=A0A1Y6EQ83_9SPHN|nr:chemotaxis protein CheB [Altererythrobacter xiamenensis]SMQ64496.1 PAS domain S-box-containing protein [Altererythrobacter xiamenensis]
MSAFNHPVVAVGASAGGIEALKALVECIPADTKATFVILQHLAPDHESQLVNILSRNAKLPCVEADKDMPVERGHIYILPPGRYLKIVDHGLFSEEPPVPHGSRMPIDYFMRSLADAAGPQSAGVVLSGTGTDGTLGLRAIKGAGGVTFAQSPETALYDGMPRAAIDGNHADEVGTISEICDGIIRFAKQSSEDVGKDFQRADLHAALALLKARLGYDFHAYKPGTISRRVRRRMNLLRFDTLGDYVEHLRSDPQEMNQLVEDMLINVTSFFRDREFWEELAEEVIKPLAENAQGKPIRVWVPACSSGEEAYSYAILFDEACAQIKPPCDWQIFATDLDEDAISKGREGRYPASIAGDVSEERLSRFFEGENSGYRVKKRLRERVVFAQQNLLSDPPFSRLDLISCRNLLIYLDAEHQGQLIETFHFALKENGFLALGTSESVPSKVTLFKPISARSHIYRRKPGRSSAQFSRNGSSSKSRSEVTSFLTEGRRESGRDLSDLVRRSLLDRYAPAGVVVDMPGNILHYSGAVRRFIETPEGEPTNNIYSLLPSSLKARVRNAVRKASSGAKVEDRHTTVHLSDSEVNIRIDCELLPDRSEDSDPAFIVTFVEIEGEPAKPAMEGGDNDQDYVKHLEHELEIVREDLQTTIEELETSNEELKASHEEAMVSNEELQSTNEELETSREELQSLNEELVTVNHQLEDKISEVEKTTDDLRNLITSTRLPVLFLDQDLNISSFTSTMSGLIELRDGDVGRPLSELAAKVDDPHLTEDAKAVLADLQPREREVESSSGAVYSRRIQPYRTSDERIGGVVATFMDITEKATVIAQLAAREKQARILAQLGEKALSDLTIDDFLSEACGALREAMSCDYAKILQLDTDEDCLKLVAGTGWNNGLVGSARVETDRKSQGGYTLRESRPILVEDFKDERRFEAPQLLVDHKVQSGISIVISVGGKPWGALGLHDREPNHFGKRDLDMLQAVANLISMAISQNQRERMLAKESVTLSLALRVADMGLWTIEPETGAATWDQKLRTITGLGSKTSSPKMDAFMERIHPEDQERIKHLFQQTVDHGAFFEAEFRFIRPDGEEIWLAGKGERMSNGTIIGINADITESKRTEEQAQFMMRELDHRVKNLLAVILSICQITSKKTNSVDAFTSSFTDRLSAIARTHSLLAQSRWLGTNLRALLQEELRTHGLDEQVELSGPEVSVSPSSAQALSMLFHELTTNAIKYGALSVPEGRLSVKWTRSSELDGSVELEWVEEGGPPVSEPTHTGFGTTVIDRIAGSELGSEIKTNWEKSGLRLSFRMSEKNVSQVEEIDRATTIKARRVPHDVLTDKNVVIVDDEWLIAEQHAHMLESAGANVIGPFTRIEPALEIDISDIDLGVLDFALENGDILPFAKKLNAAGVPIVFVTGYGSNIQLPDEFSDDLIIAKPAGASAVLDSSAWLLTRGEKRPRVSGNR